MAFSQPLTDSVRRKGQSAMLCQLCENDPKLKWKCLQCELMMCERCKEKVHPKFPSAKTHTIINLKDISKHQPDSELKPDLTRINCTVHSGQNCCLYCKTCQELVCQTCITKNHNKHEFGDISEEYIIRIEKIRNGQKNIEKEMQTMTVSEQKLKQIKSNEQSNYDRVKQEILDDDKALKNEIQKHTDKLLKELDQTWEVSVSKSFENERKKLQEHQSQIQKKIKEITNLLKSNNAKDVFSEYDSLSMEINIHPVTTLLQGISKFNHGDKTKIPLILGKLEDVTFQYNTEFQVDKRFETDLKYIDSIVSCPDGSLWICDRLSGQVQKVNPSGDNLNVISDIKIDMDDATLLRSGDLLLSVDGSSNLRLISTGSTDIQNSVYTVSPLFPSGVHVTCDNKVIVGAVKSSDINITGPRQVIVMDPTGNHEKVFQYDRHNKPLFTIPCHITSNSQGNIGVLDWVSDDDRGRVVVLDQEGEVRNIYTGHPDVNNEDNPFNPQSITTTPSDNFIVADKKNSTLHILNKEGEIVTFYNTEKIGILLPRALSFSTTGQFYIGSWPGGDKDKNADIFVINNFVF